MDDSDDLDGLAPPNCPGCLVPMGPAEISHVWECPECSLKRL